MKKTIVLVALAFGSISVSSQDLTSKKGEPILPEAGDWGIGIDATPFEKLIDLREEKIKGNSVEAGKLFKSYLEEIQRVIAAVDGIRRRTA